MSKVFKKNKPKFEKDLISMFKEFKDNTLYELKILDEPFQILNAVNLVKAFRDVCEELGYIIEHDEFFIGMNKLLNIIRKSDRDFAKKIDEMKYYYEYDNPNKKRAPGERSNEHISRFPSMVLRYKQDMIERFEQKQRDKILASEVGKNTKRIQISSHNLENDSQISKNSDLPYEFVYSSDLKTPIFLNNLNNNEIQDLFNRFLLDSIEKHKYPLAHKVFTPQRGIGLKRSKSIDPNYMRDFVERIESYRSNLSTREQQTIKYDLSIKDEIVCFNVYFDTIRNVLKTLESFGYYNKLIGVAEEFFNFFNINIENIYGQRLKSRDMRDLLLLIRKSQRGLEDWVSRVKIKYDDDVKIADKDFSLTEGEFKPISDNFDSLRQYFSLLMEQKRILAIMRRNMK